MLKLPTLGASWMLLASFSFALMGFCVKLGSADFSPAELVFYRSLFGLVPLVLIALRQRQPLKSPYWKLHLLRSMVGLVSLWLYFYALSRLPLATAVTLNYTSPLFLAALLVLFSRQDMKKPLVFTLIAGFAGVLLVLRPHMDTREGLSAFVGLLSGFGAGLAYFLLRTLGREGEPEWRTVLYFTGLSTIVLGAWLLFSHVSPIAHLTSGRLGILILLGFSATAGQLCMTRAYRVGSALLVANFAYSTIVFSSVFGILFFGEWLTVWGWAGVGLVIMAGIMASRLTRVG